MNLLDDEGIQKFRSLIVTLLDKMGNGGETLLVNAIMKDILNVTKAQRFTTRPGVVRILKSIVDESPSEYALTYLEPKDPKIRITIGIYKTSPKLSRMVESSAQLDCEEHDAIIREFDEGIRKEDIKPNYTKFGENPLGEGYEALQEAYNKAFHPSDEYKKELYKRLYSQEDNLDDYYLEFTQKVREYDTTLYKEMMEICELIGITSFQRILKAYYDFLMAKIQKDLFPAKRGEGE